MRIPEGSGARAEAEAADKGPASGWPGGRGRSAPRAEAGLTHSRSKDLGQESPEEELARPGKAYVKFYHGLSRSRIDTAYHVHGHDELFFRRAARDIRSGQLSLTFR